MQSKILLRSCGKQWSDIFCSGLCHFSCDLCNFERYRHSVPGCQGAAVSTVVIFKSPCLVFGETSGGLAVVFWILVPSSGAQRMPYTVQCPQGTLVHCIFSQSRAMMNIRDRKSKSLEFKRSIFYYYFMYCEYRPICKKKGCSLWPCLVQFRGLWLTQKSAQLSSIADC